MASSLTGSVKGHRFLITGGGSHIGSATAAQLLDAGASLVRLCDVVKTSHMRDDRWNDDRVEVHTFDIRDGDAVDRAVQGVDCVIHVASFGMSGVDQLRPRLIEDINVGGTRKLLSASERHGVKAFVYISTYNVVFNGTPIVEGDADKLAYIPEHKHTDHYSRTKCIAEQAVLSHAGSSSLRVCAVRPAAIFGEGDTRHMPRIIETINSGLGVMAIGGDDVLCDWVYADNLAHGIVLAAAALLDAARCKEVDGEAFFVSDIQPVNNFQFLREVFDDSSLFSMSVPFPVMYAFAVLTELVHGIVAPFLPFAPFLTKAEVCKVGVTHYMNMDKTAQRLGYKPLVSHQEAVARCRKLFSPLIHPPYKRNLALLQRVGLIVLWGTLTGIAIAFWIGSRKA